MTTQWTTKALAGSEDGSESDDSSGHFVVLLLYGKNSFGDKIYSYLKITLANLQKLKAKVKAGGGFTPSDFGEVVSAGKGEPSPETRAEIAANYQVLDAQKTASQPQAEIPAGKKAWDEY